jgi:hypothetical protein
LTQPDEPAAEVENGKGARVKTSNSTMYDPAVKQNLSEDDFGCGLFNATQ